MVGRQKQLLEAFVRVQAFVAEHPLTGPLTYGGAPATLDEVLPRLREYAGTQIAGRVLSSKERQQQAKLVTQLRDQHMRPIATIARTQLAAGSSELMPSAMRMPTASVSITTFLQACDGMIEAARPFEAAFIANGLPADFLARFTAVRHELVGLLGGLATLHGTRVGARKGLQVQIRRGRSAIDRIDAIVRAAYADDEVTLTKWRAAKRVHQFSGGGGARGTETTDPIEEQQAA